MMAMTSVASARVLNLGTESFAPYLRGEYQMTTMGKTPYSDSSGSGLTFSDGFATQNNYEFGFLYNIKDVSLRFGFEVIKAPQLKDVSATNASGTEMYKVSSDVSGYVPKIGIDMNFKQWQQSRLFLNAAYGYATVVTQNTFAMTAAGSAAFSGVTDFREEVKGTASLLEYSLGWEFLAFDTTTMVIDAGYRYLKVDSFSHQANATTFQGGVTKGATAYNNDGTTRALDLSGYFASVHFRFWAF